MATQAHGNNSLVMMIANASYALSQNVDNHHDDARLYMAMVRFRISHRAADIVRHPFEVMVANSYFPL